MIVIIVIVRQDVDSHFGTFQEAVNFQLLAVYQLASLEFIIRFTALLGSCKPQSVAILELAHGKFLVNMKRISGNPRV